MPNMIDPNLSVEIVSGFEYAYDDGFSWNRFLDPSKNGSLVRMVDGILSIKTRLDVPVATDSFKDY